MPRGSLSPRATLHSLSHPRPHGELAVNGSCWTAVCVPSRVVAAVGSLQCWAVGKGFLLCVLRKRLFLGEPFPLGTYDECSGLSFRDEKEKVATEGCCPSQAPAAASPLVCAGLMPVCGAGCRVGQRLGRLDSPPGCRAEGLSWASCALMGRPALPFSLPRCPTAAAPGPLALPAECLLQQLCLCLVAPVRGWVGG